MKFIVQPDGETMHVPALTAVMERPEVPTNGGAVPRQSGLIVASGPASGSGISSPCGPAATIFAWSSSVSHEGRGRSSVRASSARATPAPTTSNVAATRPATVNSLRMDPPLDQIRALRPRPHWAARTGTTGNCLPASGEARTSHAPDDQHRPVRYAVGRALEVVRGPPRADVVGAAHELPGEVDDVPRRVVAGAQLGQAKALVHPDARAKVPGEGRADMSGSPQARARLSRGEPLEARLQSPHPVDHGDTPGAVV